MIAVKTVQNPRGFPRMVPAALRTESSRVTKGGRTVKYKPTPHRVADLVMNNVRNFEVATEPAYANRWNVAGWTGAVPARSHKPNHEGSIPSPARTAKNRRIAERGKHEVTI